MDYSKLSSVGVEKPTRVTDSIKKEQILAALRKNRRIKDSFEDFKEKVEGFDGVKYVEETDKGYKVVTDVSHAMPVFKKAKKRGYKLEDYSYNKKGDEWYGYFKEEIKDSKKVTDFKFKSLKNKIKDALEETETTEEAVTTAVDFIDEETPAEDVLKAVVETLAETIDRLQGEDIVEEKVEEKEEVKEEEIEDSKISDSKKDEFLMNLILKHNATCPITGKWQIKGDEVLNNGKKVATVKKSVQATVEAIEKAMEKAMDKAEK